jgi:hypothetical protein
MADDLVEKAEALVTQHEEERAELEAPNPENEMTDEAVIELIKGIMDRPGMQKLCAMVIINWQIYAIIRQEMEVACKGDLTPEVFSALLQGLNSTAMEPFNIRDLRQNVKKKLLPWISDVSSERMKKNRRRVHGDAEQTEDDSGTVQETS